MSTTDFWRRCSGCKNEIGFETTYWVCSVSTCNRKRTGMVFCSVYCWETHLPMMRHREAFAVEKRSPSAATWQRERAEVERAEPAPATSVKTSRDPAPGPAQRRVAPEPRRVAPEPRRVAPEPRRVAPEPRQDDDLPRDILIVASKLKKYIKARSGMNTSDSVLAALSEHVRRLCDQAIRTAAENERKTVMDRDFPPAR